MLETQIVFSTKNILESVKVVTGLYSDLLLQRVYYYFPFTEEQLRAEECIQEQIERDSKKIDIKSAEKELIQFWDTHKTQIYLALNTLRDEGKTILPIYKCNLTFYGSYGYYYTPDTIFLNIGKGKSEFWAETLLHEFLHLVLYNELLNLPYSESEKIVDEMFVQLFGNIFPNYQKQF